MPKEGYYKGYETAGYIVSKQIENIEFRSYEQKLIAEVEVDGTRNEAANKGFRILAGYIFGKNISQEKLAMTSPVTQEKISEKITMTSPVTQIETKNGAWIVSFAMPKKYTLENLPKAQNDKIKFKIEKPKKVVAIKFSSLWSDKEFKKQSAKLERFIAGNGLKVKSPQIIAYYDDPFTFPWNRRNEIMFGVE